MKSIKIMAAAIALCGMTACGDNTPKTFTGFITDASMNTVTVENAEGTFTFSTMDADKSEANGLLLGAPVVVDYKGKLEDGAAAAKVATDPTYAEAVGKWTMPDPIAPATRLNWFLIADETHGPAIRTTRTMIAMISTYSTVDCPFGRRVNLRDTPLQSEIGHR